MGKSDAYGNTSGHPITLDDGSVVPAGEFASGFDSSAPLAASAIEAGLLVPTSKPEEPNRRKAGDNE